MMNDIKIKEIPVDRCGECSLIEWCGDPYEEPHLCCDERLENISVREYLSLARKCYAVHKADVAEHVLKQWKKERTQESASQEMAFSVED